MKTLFLTLAASAFALQLTACGINSTDDDQQAKASRNEQKLKETYAPVVGSYTGTIKTATAELGAKLIMFMDSVSDGVDTNGAPLSHTVLKGQLKLNTVGVLDDHTFLVDYKSFDATATFSQDSKGASSDPRSTPIQAGSSVNGGCLVGEHDSTLSINGGHFRGDEFTGTLLRQSGVIGTITMHRTSTDALQPIRDQAERLSAAYAPLLGTYGGGFVATVKPSDPTAKPSDFPIRLDIIMNYYNTTGGVRCPLLLTQYSRPDISTTGVGQIMLYTTYNQGESRLLFQNYGDTSGPKYLTFDANWSAPMLVSTIAQWDDYIGNITAQKCVSTGVDANGKCCPGPAVDVRGMCCKAAQGVDSAGHCH